MDKGRIGGRDHGIKGCLAFDGLVFESLAFDSLVFDSLVFEREICLTLPTCL
jgi:hypothetical protein